MQAVRREAEDVLPFDFGGHLHTSIAFMRPYALRMQPYALITHFLPASRNRPGSRAGRTSKKPYALYAPLLGVGPFSSFWGIVFVAIRFASCRRGRQGFDFQSTAFSEIKNGPKM